jgi:hypothetical protein
MAEMRTGERSESCTAGVDRNYTVLTNDAVDITVETITLLISFVSLKVYLVTIPEIVYF